MVQAILLQTRYFTWKTQTDKRIFFSILPKCYHIYIHTNRHINLMKYFKLKKIIYYYEETLI